MARSTNFLTKNLSGHLDRMIVFKQYGDKTVVSKYPNMSRRKLSKKQRKVNEIMADANYEAKTILADEQLRREAQLRLNVTRNQLYRALVSEYFKNAGAVKNGQ